MNEQKADWPSKDELLAYVQGKLSDEATSRIRATIELDEQLAAEVAFMTGLRAAVQEGPETQSVVGEFGWRRLEAELDRLDVQRPKHVVRSKWLQYAAAGLACVSVLQGALLYRVSSADEAGFHTASSITHKHVLAVSFALNTTELDMRALLTELDAEIVGGPNSSGLYRLAFESSATASEALEALQQNPLVELVAEQ